MAEELQKNTKPFTAKAAKKGRKDAKQPLEFLLEAPLPNFELRHLSFFAELFCDPCGEKLLSPLTQFWP
jgi:hypothetical protein